MNCHMQLRPNLLGILPFFSDRFDECLFLVKFSLNQPPFSFEKFWNILI